MQQTFCLHLVQLYFILLCHVIKFSHLWECLWFVMGWRRRSFFLLWAPTSDTSTQSATILMKLTPLFTHLPALSRLEHFRDIIWIVYHFTHQLKWNGIYGREDFPQEPELDQFGVSLPSDYGPFILTSFFSPVWVSILNK